MTDTATPDQPAAAHPASIPVQQPAAVRQALLERSEIALIDLREEDPYAQEHPLWAANLPLSRLEIEAWDRIPRRDTPIVLFGVHAGQDLVPLAAQRLAALGYTRVHALAGGLDGWKAAGGEVFRDVNVPSKSFGEWVEHHRGTPSLSAEQVQALIDGPADVVVVDARRFDEYRTMSIPGATSVPGAELVLRIAELVRNPATQVIVNCAGRTRSIIGTQSLVNAGILPNPVAALRNGTIGWLLAGQVLEHGATRAAPAVSAATLATARDRAQAVARAAGVRRTSLAGLADLARAGRTVYRLDVRTPEEYEAGHLPGFASAPGGQLVQETDHHASVRGAHIVLDDSDGVRAPMTASWLAQMGWDVHLLEGVEAAARSDTGAWKKPLPATPPARTVDAQTLAGWLESARDDPSALQVLDFTSSANHVKGHVPGAWFAIRAQAADALRAVPAARRYVATCGSSLLARFAVQDLQAALKAAGSDAEVLVLDGGNAAWAAAGLPLETGDARLANPRTDRYRRPYEGTDAPREAMQAYLDWEFGLVEQLQRDGTHHFTVI
ncbi:rhodanese-related sulfurtransferase [Paracidovorax cattleyae]|uniref:Rhodanese-related sulfurtransferase n=1 Tax=Paracidovorax cattleyae TaxID=80868 RepID=A0A1H0WNV1_9BURK|nr:rhodanese-related sulfurtransferase [Paracidovorax cattleyae]SDP92364.1 Rhodanese-related sulfurtransferase [Paracidovorax cattleyae]